MTDIASNVERIIDKLDGMTTEIVPKTYGTDIASKVDHIAKQLDYVQAGGGSGGEKIIVNAEYGWDENEQRYQNIDATYEEILDMINSEKEVIIRLRMPHFGSDIVDISYLRLVYVKNNEIRFNIIYLYNNTVSKFVNEDYVLLSEDGSVDINSRSDQIKS